jgi:Integrase core domain
LVASRRSLDRPAGGVRIDGSGTRHRKTKPFTPKHNGKVERYQRILAEELLYAREYTCEHERSAAIAVWNIHHNYHRPHTTANGQPPASRLTTGVTNVQPSYT